MASLGFRRYLVAGVLFVQSGLEGTILRSSHMNRGALSTGFALILALVLAAGACLACSQMVPKSRCCQKHTSCSGYTPAPLEAHCANPKVDLDSAELSTVVTVDLFVAALPGPQVPVVSSRDSFPPSPPIVACGSPDLYLLHSSLTI